MVDIPYLVGDIPTSNDGLRLCLKLGRSYVYTWSLSVYPGLAFVLGCVQSSVQLADRGWFGDTSFLPVQEIQDEHYHSLHSRPLVQGFHRSVDCGFLDMFYIKRIGDEKVRRRYVWYNASDHLSRHNQRVSDCRCVYYLSLYQYYKMNVSSLFHGSRDPPVYES